MVSLYFLNGLQLSQSHVQFRSSAVLFSVCFEFTVAVFLLEFEHFVAADLSVFAPQLPPGELQSGLSY